MLKTPPCQLVAHCETAGGPVCICSLDKAEKWIGSEQPASPYWTVTAKMGLAALFQYNEDYQFFNTETGNFTFFRGPDILVLAEIISIEETATIPWRGIEFDVKPQTYLAVNLNGLTSFFDATISPQLKVSQEGMHAIDQHGTWNAATLFCHYQASYEVEFLSSKMYLAGVCFLKKGSSSAA